MKKNNNRGLVMVLAASLVVSAVIEVAYWDYRHVQDEKKKNSAMEQSYTYTNEVMKQASYMEGYNQALQELYEAHREPTVEHKYVYSTDNGNNKLYELDYTYTDGVVTNISTKEVNED